MEEIKKIDTKEFDSCLKKTYERLRKTTKNIDKEILRILLILLGGLFAYSVQTKNISHYEMLTNTIGWIIFTIVCTIYSFAFENLIAKHRYDHELESEQGKGLEKYKIFKTHSVTYLIEYTMQIVKINLFVYCIILTVSYFETDLMKYKVNKNNRTSQKKVNVKIDDKKNMEELETRIKKLEEEFNKLEMKNKKK